MTTDHRKDTCCFPGSVYYDLRYVSGYTNNGNLIGNWIGRGGYGGQGWVTHWFSPRTKLQVSYRHQEVDRAFIGGGRLDDYGVGGDIALSPEVVFSGSLQYEQWKFPVLSTTGQSNVTASFQLTYSPHWRSRGEKF
jgi:hypothetical protein